MMHTAKISSIGAVKEKKWKNTKKSEPWYDNTCRQKETITTPCKENESYNPQIFYKRNNFALKKKFKKQVKLIMHEKYKNDLINQINA